MEQIKEMLTENPSLLGLVFAIVGVLGLLGAIFNWSWLFKDVSGVTYSLKKIDGWVNMFGVKTARIVFGIGSVVIITIRLALVLFRHVWVSGRNKTHIIENQK